MTRRESLALSARLLAAAALVPALPAAEDNDPNPLRNDPQRPVFHFLPRKNWMNDPNGLVFYNNQYHLFYQHNPNAAKWGDMHWGHAVSADMVQWKHMPIALAPTPGGYDKDGVFSGCAVMVDGKPVFVFTGVWPEVQATATSNDPDLRTLVKSAKPILSQKPAALGAITAFRDPNVWKEDGKWMMTLGTGLPDGRGAVLLYSAPKLDGPWTFLHTLIEAKDKATKDWECPQFFPLGDKHVLLVGLDSPVRKVIYFVGTYKNQKFTPELQGDFDNGGSYYAPLAFEAKGNRRVVFGWLQEMRTEKADLAAQWSGVQSLPRQLSLGKNGLVIEPVEELRGLRGSGQSDNDVDLGENTYQLVPAGDTFEVMASFALGTAKRVGLRLRVDGDGREKTLLYYDRESSQLVIDTTASSLTKDNTTGVYHAALTLGADEPLRLRLFVDRSVVEVFANDRVTMTTRIYPTTSAEFLQPYADGGTAKMIEGTAWPLASIWG